MAGWLQLWETRWDELGQSTPRQAQIGGGNGPELIMSHLHDTGCPTIGLYKRHQALRDYILNDYEHPC